MTVTRKLLIPTLLGIVLAIGTLVLINLRSQNSLIFEREDARLAEAYATFYYMLDDRGHLAQALATSVADMDSVRAAFAAGDREQLLALVQPMHRELALRYQVMQMHFHLPPAVSFLRVNAADSFGDDESSFRSSVVNANMDKTPQIGLEIGRTGIGIRGVAPIAHQGKYIGAIELGVGLGNFFLEQFKARTGADAAVYLTKKANAISTLSPIPYTPKVLPGDLGLIARTSLDAEAAPELFTRALQGENVIDRIEINNRPYVINVGPLYDYGGSIIGAIQISLPRGNVVEAIAAGRNNSLLWGGVICLLAALAVWRVAARTVSRPLSLLSQGVQRLGSGDRVARVHIGGRDEFGRLGSAFNAMTDEIAGLLAGLERRVEERTAELTREVAERKHAEEALRASEAMFRALAELAPAAIFIMQEEWYRYVNPAFETITKYSREEALSMRFWDVIHPDSRELVRERGLARQRGEDVPSRYENRILTKDGKTKWVDFTATLIEYEGKAAILGFAVDLTDRKLAELTLRESEERYRSFFENSMDAILLTTPDGAVLAANPQACRVFQRSEDEIRAVGADGLVDKADPRLSVMLTELVQRGRFRGELTYVRKDGARFPAEISSARFRDQKNHEKSIIILRDVTERKKMEDDLLKARKLESVGLLAGGIAHDFNNMLTGILGNISLARVDVPPDAGLFKRIVEAEKACLRAKDLTQQLLAFSKGGAPVKKMASMRELITDSVGFALSGSNVRHEISFSDDLWPLEVDEGQISQVIHNLIINAAQAMPRGGSVRVSCENTVVDENVLPVRPGKYIRMSIEDDGHGIPEDHLHRVFDPYFTTREEGRGLGLASVYAIIKHHEGCITIRSQSGEGTTFDVYLPASEPQMAFEREDQETLLTGSGRILLMDDEDMVRDVAGEILRMLGYEVELARDGAEVIEQFKEAKRSSRSFDAVILDLTVPGGIGGKEALRLLREIDPNVKCLVSSGYSNDPVMAEYAKHGFVGVVSKPYRIEDLSMALREVVGGNAG